MLTVSALAVTTFTFLSAVAVFMLSASSVSRSPEPSALSGEPAPARQAVGSRISAPTPVTTSRIDGVIQRMDWGNIAFNAPAKMKLDSPSNIQLVLSPSHSIDELKKLIVAEGEKEGTRIRITDRMEARLSGTDFQISAITPELQAVTWNDTTVWKWEVRPQQPGRHNLYLTLTAVLDVEGSSLPRTIRTFDKTIEVEVSGWQTVFLLFRENWEWAWTLIALPVGGLLWKRRQTNKGNSVEVTHPNHETPQEVASSGVGRHAGDRSPDQTPLRPRVDAPSPRNRQGRRRRRR